MYPIASLVMLSIAVFSVQIPSEKPAIDSKVVEFVIADNSASEFLIESLSIIDSQRNEIFDVVGLARKEWLELAFGAVSAEKTTEEREAESKVIFDRCRKSIEKILLDRQVVELEQFINQRKIGLKARVDSALLPLVMLKELDSKSTSECSPTFKALVKEYERQKQELKRKHVGGIFHQDDAPEELGRFSLVVEKLNANGLPSGHPTKPIVEYIEDDFDRFEKDAFAQTVIGLILPGPLADELSLTGDQVNALKKEIVRDLNDYPMEDRFDRGYFRLIMKTPDDQNVEIKEQLREKYHKWKAHEFSVASKNAQTRLLPFQLEQLQQIARFRRDQFESGYGDFFGIVHAWASLNKHENAVKAVSKSRECYYRDLKTLKEKTWQSMLDTLPEDGRAKFIQRFGADMYDYNFEQVYRWDSAKRDSARRK